MPECPTGWENTTIGEVVTLQRGHDITRADQRPGPVPVVSSGGISSWHDQAMARGPGVVLGRKGTLGHTYYVDRDYWPHDTTLWVSDFKGNDPRFVYYFFSNLDFRYLDVGSANPTLNRNHVHPLPTMWPPIGEQRAIAGVLGILDDKIKANQDTTKLQEELATRLLEQTPERIPLSHLAIVQRNMIDPASLGPTMVDHFSLPAFDDYRLPGNQAGVEIKSVKQAIDDVSVLVSRLNPHIPRIWYAVPQSGVVGVASTEFVVLAPRSGISAEELWACCNSASFSSALAENVTGTTGSHQRVQAADALSIEVGNPYLLSPGERLAIATLVKSAHHLRIESVSLANLRETLRPDLLCGELRVRDPESFIAGMP